MKTFKDLEFEIDHQLSIGLTVAELFFDNGYGIAVVKGERALSTYISPDNDNDYKITILNNTNPYYGSRIVKSIVGYHNEAEVTKIMKQIQELGKNKTSKDKVKA